MGSSNGVIISKDVMIEEYEVHTGAAAIAASLAPGEAFHLLGFELHLNAALSTSQDFTVTKDAGAGTAYDTELYSRDLGSDSVKDLIYYFDKPIKCYHKDDEIDFAYTNTDTKTYGLTIYWGRLKS